MEIVFSSVLLAHKKLYAIQLRLVLKNSLWLCHKLRGLEIYEKLLQDLIIPSPQSNFHGSNEIEKNPVLIQWRVVQFMWVCMLYDVSVVDTEYKSMVVWQGKEC